MKENKIFKAVFAAVFCALVFTMTFISIPAPSVGNINLGDCMVILSACLIGGWYGVFAGAVGSALCDLANGYAIYAPGTLIIKALMVVVILMAYRQRGRQALRFFPSEPLIGCPDHRPAAWRYSVFSGNTY